MPFSTESESLVPKTVNLRIFASIALLFCPWPTPTFTMLPIVFASVATLALLSTILRPELPQLSAAILLEDTLMVLTVGKITLPLKDRKRDDAEALKYNRRKSVPDVLTSKEVVKVESKVIPEVLLTADPAVPLNAVSNAPVAVTASAALAAVLAVVGM